MQGAHAWYSSWGF